MRKFLLAAGIAGSVAAAGVALPSRADAMPSGSAAGIALAADSLNVVDTVQFLYGGHKHCWYVDGWKGPGWYWCGYAKRVGLGWGGPAGFRGWVYRPAPVVVVKPRVRERVIVKKPIVREKVIVR
jgi:hypothetical protein